MGSGSAWTLAVAQMGGGFRCWVVGPRGAGEASCSLSWLAGAESGGEWNEEWSWVLGRSSGLHILRHPSEARGRAHATGFLVMSLGVIDYPSSPKVNRDRAR